MRRRRQPACHAASTQRASWRPLGVQRLTPPRSAYLPWFPQGECLLLSRLAGVRSRTAPDNSLGRVYGVLDTNDLPRSPPAPPPPEPPVVVALGIGISGTSKQQFGPAKQQRVEDVLEQSSGGAHTQLSCLRVLEWALGTLPRALGRLPRIETSVACDSHHSQAGGMPARTQTCPPIPARVPHAGGATTSIASIAEVPAVRFVQQRSSATAGGIIIKARLAYPKRQAAKATQFARRIAAGGAGTAWVTQISPRAAVDSSSVRLAGQRVLLPPPPSPAPPPPSSINGGGGRGGGRPGGGSVRPVRPRAALEVEPAAALAAAPCSSVFFSLPK